jgi:trimethylamine:corrinoid methyltransferase-like protein
LKEKITRKLYREEFYRPSPVVDRGSLREWKENGSMDSFLRAKKEARKIISNYEEPEIDKHEFRAMTELVSSYAKEAGMEQLPEINSGLAGIQ